MQTALSNTMHLNDALTWIQNSNKARSDPSMMAKGSSLVRGVGLRREFDNFGSAARTVCSRWSRGVYRTSKRPSEPCVVDSRGQSVRSLGMALTFLTDSEVDELVAAYEAGATLRRLAKQFHIHRLTAAAYLARRGVPVRRAGLDSVQRLQA